MVKKLKFKLNSAGVVQLMKSAEMQTVLNEYGGRAASSAGSGFADRMVMSGDRAKVFVYADTDDAKHDNLKNNTLLKAIGGGS